MSGLMLVSLTACGSKETSGTADVSPADSGVTEETENTDSPEETAEEDPEEPEEYEVPELTYQMASLSVQAEPTEYGYTYSNYAIDINEVGFTFFGEMTVYDKSTGEECGWANDYDWSAYKGEICVEETAHYSYKYMDGWFDYWATDRSTLIVMIEHKGDVLAPENIQIVANMEYNGHEAGKYTFEVNAEADDLKYNESRYVHGVNLLKLKGETFVPELGTVSMGGGSYDYDNNKWADGYGFTFIHVGEGDFSPEDYIDCFSPMIWDDEKKDFVPYEIPEGFDLRTEISKDGNEMRVFIGLEAGMDAEIPYELYEGMVPQYDDGEVQMIICWN